MAELSLVARMRKCRRAGPVHETHRAIGCAIAGMATNIFSPPLREPGWDAQRTDRPEGGTHRMISDRYRCLPDPFENRKSRTGGGPPAAFSQLNPAFFNRSRYPKSHPANVSGTIVN